MSYGGLGPYRAENGGKSSRVAYLGVVILVLDLEKVCQHRPEHQNQRRKRQGEQQGDDFVFHNLGC